MRKLFLTSALCTSLSAYPIAAGAQSYDTMRLSEEVLNSAANYTAVLRTAHSEVHKYITWRHFRTRLSEKEQKERTAAVIAAIEAGESVSSDLVPTLQMDTLNSYDVRFRYCDNKLLTYFGTPGFKHNFSAEQIAEAPVLRAQRRGERYTGYHVGVVESGPAGFVLSLLNGARKKKIPDCLISGDYPTTIPAGTVAYVGEAAQRFGVARLKRTRETRESACPAGRVGSGQREERYLTTPFSAQGKQAGEPYYDDSEGGDGNWTVTSSFCRVPATVRRRNVESCDAVIRGPNKTFVRPGEGRAVYDYYVTEAQDPSDWSKTVWLPSDRHGNYTSKAVGTLSPMSNCDGLDATATLTPSVKTKTQTGTLACSDPNYWTHGQRKYERSITKTTYTYSGAKPGWEDGVGAKEVAIEKLGDWKLTRNSCRRAVHETTTQTTTGSCPSGNTGTVTYKKTTTVTGTDWQAHEDDLTTTVSPWEISASNCEPCRGGHWTGGNGDNARYVCSSGSSGERGGSWSPSENPSNPDNSGGGRGGGDKIVCTAMNAAYGFGSFRQAIWLAHARDHMTAYHQTGYHLLALPLVRRAYGQDDTLARGLRRSLEHIARERTADIRAGKRGTHRRPLGRLYRAVLEPLCYGVGRLAGGRPVAAIEDVPAIAGRLNRNTSIPV